MAVLGMRHAVLWVTNPEASALFYSEVLGLEQRAKTGAAIFLSSPSSETDHDLGLFPASSPNPSGRSAGLYHLAWEVATLADLVTTREAMIRTGSHTAESDHGASKSIYGKDPDGIEFEVMWEVPLELLEDTQIKTAVLDLNADIAKFGSDTPGRGATT